MVGLEVKITFLKGTLQFKDICVLIYIVFSYVSI